MTDMVIDLRDVSVVRGEAELLILDEPTEGLDMPNRARVVKVLDGLRMREARVTMVVVSNHLEELPSYLDQVVLLNNGSIVSQGHPEEVLTSENLSRAFGCRIEVIKNNGRFMASAVL